MKSSFSGFFKDKNVFITGHTGFKGSWLTFWLTLLGAKVTGFSLAPPTEPALFNELGLEQDINHIIGDIQDLPFLRKSIKNSEPEIIFHCAAQPLVRKSYDYPVDTFSTNVMGTVNVLEALRGCKSVSACLCITSDKCYENMESPYAYRENDPLGGGDPYSASKGCAEIVVASYRRSFFGKEGDSKHLIGVSTARAGNVIGGGDWAADRIFPDSVKSLSKGNDVPIRNLKAIRPWQHVLEPLAGYLWLTAKMAQSPANFSDAWNFGPYSTSCVSVETLVEKIIKAWGWGGMINLSKGQTGGRHEANFLRLDCSKAFGLIDWHPSLTLDDSVKFATEWYKNFYHKKNFDARAFTEKQIRHYVEISHRAGLPWAKL